MTTPEVNVVKPNKKVQASLQMQQKILAATIDILGTDGYSAVTASNLSQKAKISKGVLYHHFANLNDIRLAALAVLIEQFMEAGDPSQACCLEEYLAATGEALFEKTAKNSVAMKALYAFVMQALVDDSIKTPLQRLVRHALEQYQHVFQHFCPEANAEALAEVVQALDAYFGGAILHWYLMDDPARCLASWQQFRRMLVRHLEAVKRQ